MLLDGLVRLVRHLLLDFVHRPLRLLLEQVQNVLTQLVVVLCVSLEFVSVVRVVRFRFLFGYVANNVDFALPHLTLIDHRRIKVFDRWLDFLHEHARVDHGWLKSQCFEETRLQFDFHLSVTFFGEFLSQYEGI